MNDARVNRSAAETDDHQPHDSAGIVRQRQQHANDTDQHECLAQANHGRIVELHGQKATRQAAYGDADAEQAGPHGGCGLVDAFAERHVATTPQHGRGFQRTVAEEHHQDFFGTANGKHASYTKRFASFIIGRSVGFAGNFVRLYLGALLP